MWSNRVQTFITLQFQRLNINDEYNYGMGNVDVADQLRNVYRLMSGARKTKWWWAPMMWAFGIMLTNAYAIYKWVTGKSDHYRFLHAIALAWLDPEQYGPNAVSTSGKRKRSADTDSEDEPEPDPDSDSDCDDSSRYDKRPRPKVKGQYVTQNMVLNDNLQFRYRNVGEHTPRSAQDIGLNPKEMRCVPCRSKWMFKIPKGMTNTESQRYFKSSEYMKLKRKGTAVRTRGSLWLGAQAAG